MFHQLTAGRFLLRQIVAADQAVIFEGLSHPDVIRFYGVSYHSMEATAAQMDFYNNLLLHNTGCWWGICENTNPGQLIGTCGLNDRSFQHHHVEVGYWLLPAHQGKGVMVTCLPLVLQYAFENMKVHRVVAVVEEGNDRSGRLLRKQGFKLEGALRESEWKNGRFVSLQYYGLLQRDAVTA